MGLAGKAHRKAGKMTIFKCVNGVGILEHDGKGVQLSDYHLQRLATMNKEEKMNYLRIEVLKDFYEIRLSKEGELLKKFLDDPNFNLKKVKFTTCNE